MTILEEFQRYLIKKELEESTIKTYSILLKQIDKIAFNKFNRLLFTLLENNAKNITCINQKELCRLLRKILFYKWDSGISKIYFNQIVSSINNFSHFLFQMFSIELPEYKQMKFFKLPKSLDAFSFNRIKLLILNQLNLSCELRAIFLLIINHGLTYKEILSIRTSLIDHKEGSLFVLSKNHLSLREIELTPSEKTVLIQFIQKHEGSLADKFLFHQRKEGGYQKALKVLKRIGKELSLNVTPSLLRNSFIRQALEKSIPEHIVQNYLGLKTLTSIFRFKSYYHLKINLAIVNECLIHNQEGSESLRRKKNGFTGEVIEEFRYASTRSKDFISISQDAAFNS